MPNATLKQKLEQFSSAQRSEWMRRLVGLQNHLAYLADLYEFVEAEMQVRPAYSRWKKWAEEYQRKHEKDVGLRPPARYLRYQEKLFEKSMPGTFRWHAVKIATISEKLHGLLKKYDFDPFLKEGVQKIKLEDLKSLWKEEALDKLSAQRLREKKTLVKIASSRRFEEMFFKESVLVESRRETAKKGLDILIDLSEIFRTLHSDYEVSLAKIGVIKFKKIGTPAPIDVLAVGLTGGGGVGHIIWDMVVSRDPSSMFSGSGLVGCALGIWRARIRRR